jgi:hypothetical protein
LPPIDNVSASHFGQELVQVIVEHGKELRSFEPTRFKEESIASHRQTLAGVEDERGMV